MTRADRRSPARPDRAGQGHLRPRSARDRLAVEQIVAVESPREFRLNPRDRLIVYTAESAGARQLFAMPLRGGTSVQLTASEEACTDPQWSPDGRRLAFVRKDAIWVIEADGSRLVRVTDHPAGNSRPRWSPDGQRLAFVSRRRGWSQVWIIDAPVPRRGRPAAHPLPPEPRQLSGPGIDVEDFAWSPDGRRLALMARAQDDLVGSVSILDVTGREEPRRIGRGAWETGGRWVSDGSLLFVSDASGWFQVVRLLPDGRERTSLTSGGREHGEPSGGFGFAPLPSPDGSRFVHIEVHDGLVDLVVVPLAAARRRGRGRPATEGTTAETLEGVQIDPWDGVWRAIDWTPDGAWVLAIGENETRPQDLWLLPVPNVAPAGATPRQLTDSLPAVLRPVVGTGGPLPGERIAFVARDGLRIEGTLWRPPQATGRRDGERVPAIIYPHGGPTAQAYRGWVPFKLLLAREGMAFLDVDFRGSTGYGRAFREANQGEWGHADVHDIVDAGRWLLEQSWCDGRLAVYGGSYGGYLVLSALVDAPALWRAGVDLFGDSEIAESYRRGDRVGRLDLEQMMGRPDDPTAGELYRRGSPVYRAERIEAPLLILHGRRDKRVVPLMSEKMVEALEIEGKHHEVVWYDEEAHGWERRENRRNSFNRILAFLRLHLLETPDPD